MIVSVRQQTLLIVLFVLAAAAACWGVISVTVHLTSQFEQQPTPAPTAVSQPGLVITAVSPDSPAAAAGLLAGHVILSANNLPTNDVQALQTVVENTPAGGSITLIVLVDGQRRQTTAVRAAQRPFLGVEVVARAAYTPSPETATPLPAQTPVTPAGWATISRVVPGAPADRAGLEVGDVITAVDTAAILTGEELAQAIAARQPGDEIRLTLRRGPETLAFSVTLAAAPGEPQRAYLGIELQP